MFIGHYAVALGARQIAPNTSLGTLFLAAQLVDLLWPMFLLLGLEHVRIDPGNTVVTPLDFYDYPITHSLLGSLGWAVGLGIIYWTVRRNLKGAWIVGGTVLSHWVLDAIAHRPDLPILPGGGPMVGLGLWNSLPGTIVVELGLFIAGLAIYLRSTRSQDRTGFYGLWCLIVILVLIWLGSVFGPPPPSEIAIGFAGLSQWLFVLWGYWVDRHREPKCE
jgi:hypothetical protein